MQIIQTRDYETIAQLNKDVHDLHSQLYPDYFKVYDYELMKVFFERIIEKPNFIFLLLENEQEYIGYAWLEIKEYSENAFMKSYKSLFVHQLSINKEERNKGFGGKLMDRIVEIAESHETRRIELDYWYDNEQAKSFYYKKGYKKYREFVYKEI